MGVNNRDAPRVDQMQGNKEVRLRFDIQVCAQGPHPRAALLD